MPAQIDVHGARKRRCNQAPAIACAGHRLVQHGRVDDCAGQRTGLVQAGSKRDDTFQRDAAV